MENYTYRKLVWDTNYFECESSRIDVENKLINQDIIEIKKLVQTDEFITITNSKAMMGNNRQITQELGAYLVDINVQLTNSRITVNRTQVNPSIIITNNYPANEEIVELVKQAFTNSRFYNDELLSRDKVAGIYTNWVKNAFSTEEKFFCVLEDNHIIQGFLLFSFNQENIITIELIAVKADSRQSGVGTQLIQSLYQYCVENQYTTVNVGTQIENIQALNFYTKNDLKIKDIKYIHHMWNK